MATATTDAWTARATLPAREQNAFAQRYQHAVLLVVDVETDGPNVRANSMFAVGGVAIEVATKRVLGGFSFNIKEREGASKAESTMDFWRAPAQAAMYERLHQNAKPAAMAMQEVATWLRALKAAHPLAQFTFASDCLPFDMRWIDAELTEHVAPMLLGYAGLDIYSYAAGALGMPRHRAWKGIDALKRDGVLCRAADGVAHDHHPYHDALHEAVLAVDLMRHAERAPWAPLDVPRADLLTAAAVTNSTWLVQAAGVTVLALDAARSAG
jgi:hypothetical protein